MFPLKIGYDKVEKIMELSEEAIETNSMVVNPFDEPISVYDILKLVEDEKTLKEAGIEDSFMRLESYLHSLTNDEMSEVAFLYYVGRGQEYNFETYRKAVSDPKEGKIDYISHKIDLSKCLKKGLIEYKATL
jgi:hypothetical protein